VVIAVRGRQRPDPPEDWPAVPDEPEPCPPDSDSGDEILPEIGPHGPGGGEPDVIAPESEPDTHDDGDGEP
jgi:hypothetical protein